MGNITPLPPLPSPPKVFKQTVTLLKLHLPLGRWWGGGRKVYGWKTKICKPGPGGTPILQITLNHIETDRQTGQGKTFWGMRKRERKRKGIKTKRHEKGRETGIKTKRHSDCKL